MNSFTFYKNYYELIKYLKPSDRMILYDAIMKFIFDNEEPQLNGLLNGIWINLKMPLNTSKNNSGRGGRPKKNKEEIKTDLKPNKNRLEIENKTEKKTNNISTFLFLISNNKYKYIILDNKIYNKIQEWLEYKEERKEKYKETGLNNLLKQIDNKVGEYGEDAVINLISECMANNWKGIIFEKLEKINKSNKKSCEWFNEDIVSEPVNEETKKVFDDFNKFIEEVRK